MKQSSIYGPVKCPDIKLDYNGLHTGAEMTGINPKTIFLESSYEKSA